MHMQIQLKLDFKEGEEMNFFSKKANDILPYVPGEQPKDGEYIKLNTNENAYPPSPKVKKALDNLDVCRLKLYPDPESTILRETMAEILSLNKENIFVGNGSDEVLAIAFQTFFMEKDNILMPDISYSFYPVYRDMYNVKAKIVPLKDNFTIDINDYIVPNNGIIIANPNAPTSISLSRDEIEVIVKNNTNSVVIIDEAYVDFGGETVVSLINKYNNLLVIRTLSKSYSLAGLRVGFAIGNKELIKGMNKIKNSFNSYPIDFIAQTLAVEAIKDVEYFDKTRNMIIDTKERIRKELENIGFTVLDSKTNFLFIMHKNKKAEDIYNDLRKNKVLVRFFNKPKINNWLRVTIGTDEQMDRFIKIIKEIVG